MQQSQLAVLPFVPTAHSAVGNRDAKAVVNIAAAWEDAAEDAVHQDWARATHDAIKQYSTGGTYVNFLSDDEPDARTRSAYRDNYERLRDVKRAWDPQNLFRNNKNITP